MAEQLIKVTTSDGESHEIAKSTLEKSVLLRGIIDENPDEEIPMPTISGPVFKKCVEYCEYIKDHDAPQIEKPIRSTDMKEIVEDEYYVNLVNGMDKDMTIEVLLASKYLDIPGLLNLTCAKLATQMRDQTLEETR